MRSEEEVRKEEMKEDLKKLKITCGSCGRPIGEGQWISVEEYWKKRSEFMEDLIYGCGGSISDCCNKYIENNPLPSALEASE